MNLICPDALFKKKKAKIKQLGIMKIKAFMMNTAVQKVRTYKFNQ